MFYLVCAKETFHSSDIEIIREEVANCFRLFEGKEKILYEAYQKSLRQNSEYLNCFWYSFSSDKFLILKLQL